MEQRLEQVLATLRGESKSWFDASVNNMPTFSQCSFSSPNVPETVDKDDSVARLTARQCSARTWPRVEQSSL